MRNFRRYFASWPDTRTKMRDELLKDLEAMEEAMIRTADRCDIWQDRVIYAIAKAVYHLITYILRRDKQ